MYYPRYRSLGKEFKRQLEDPVSSEGDKNSGSDLEETWILHVNGSSNSSRSRAGFILSSSEEDVAAYALHFEFSTTNNEAKYEALIVGLKIA